MVDLSPVAILQIAGLIVAIVVGLFALVFYLKKRPSLRVEFGGKAYQPGPDDPIPPRDYGPWNSVSIRITNLGDLPAKDIKLEVVQETTRNKGGIDEVETYWREEREMESLGSRESKDWSITVLERPGFVVRWSHKSILFRRRGERTLELPSYLF